jgi:hypothetical protein
VPFIADPVDGFSAGLKDESNLYEVRLAIGALSYSS